MTTEVHSGSTIVYYLSLGQHVETLVIALDISKVFHILWHSAFLNKVPFCGLPPQTCSWVRSYLSERCVSFTVNRHNSDFLFQLILGCSPRFCVYITFLLYINDLVSFTFRFIHSNVDDCTIPVSNIRDNQ